jgi:hypothetical protein
LKALKVEKFKNAIKVINDFVWSFLGFSARSIRSYLPGGWQLKIFTIKIINEEMFRI